MTRGGATTRLERRAPPDHSLEAGGDGGGLNDGAGGVPRGAAAVEQRGAGVENQHVVRGEDFLRLPQVGFELGPRGGGAGGLSGGAAGRGREAAGEGVSLGRRGVGRAARGGAAKAEWE